MADREHTGRAGEYLAASVLEQHGCHVVHVTIYGADLWVQTPSRRIARVEVKTASEPVRQAKHGRGGGSISYRFGHYMLDPAHIDAIIYVALDIGLLLVHAPDNPRSKMSPNNFTPDRQDETIRRFFY